MYNYHYWGFQTLPAFDNMALEEYFLKHSATTKKAHIRFYDFAKDTVVLGYNQSTEAVKQNTPDFTVTRRGTGGSHVHVSDNVLAYSFIVPRDGNFKNHPDFRAYYADIIAKALQTLGIQDIVVDNDASTIMTDNKVIASHALRWGVRSALLHGIIHIRPYDVEKMMQRIYLAQRQIGSKTYSEADALRNIPTLVKILPEIKPNATPEQREQYFKQLLAETILRETAGKDYTKQELTERIILEAREQHRKRNTQEWLKHRDPVFTQDEIEELPGEKLDEPLKKGWGYCLYMQVPDKDFKKMTEPKDKF